MLQNNNGMQVYWEEKDMGKLGCISMFLANKIQQIFNSV